MQAGFAQVDITPRVGVELSGFGPYLHRCARDVRDRLYARAMAAGAGRRRWVLVAADLIGVDEQTAAEARSILGERTRLPPECVMFHATHTHSGPATIRGLIGWGEPDEPYMARLPFLLARAGEQALANLRDVEFRCARVPVEGISYNRELEARPAYDAALGEDWRPAAPEHTDTTAWVVTAQAGGKVVGLLTCFSCHPVVCCEQTHSIHGDYCGVAMNALAAERAPAVCLFCQGAHGDLNTCVCHQPPEESLRALDVIAGRFARCVRAGIRRGEPLREEAVSAAMHEFTVRRRPVPAGKLREEIARQVKVILDDPNADAGRDARMATVFLKAARKVLARVEAGRSLDETTCVQALRLGELLILGLPFELFRGIKESILRAIGRAPTLVLSNVNDCLGYAVAREMYARADLAHYAREVVPWMRGSAPFREELEDDLVAACLKLTEAVK